MTKNAILTYFSHIFNVGLLEWHKYTIVCSLMPKLAIQSVFYKSHLMIKLAEQAKYCGKPIHMCMKYLVIFIKLSQIHSEMPRTVTNQFLSNTQVNSKKKSALNDANIKKKKSCQYIWTIPGTEICKYKRKYLYKKI